MTKLSPGGVPLTDLRRLRASVRRLQQVLSARLRTCCPQVTLAQCHVLLQVEAHGESTTGRLAEELFLDKSTLSRTVDGLVERGLLRRDASCSDRRVIPLSLTPQGRDTCDAIHRVNDAYFRQVLGRIPASDRRSVIRNFIRFVQAAAGHEADVAQAVRHHAGERS